MKAHHAWIRTTSSVWLAVLLALCWGCNGPVSPPDDYDDSYADTFYEIPFDELGVDYTRPPSSSETVTPPDPQSEYSPQPPTIRAATKFKVTVTPALGLINVVNTLFVYDEEGNRILSRYWEGIAQKLFDFALNPGTYRFVGISTTTEIGRFVIATSKYGYVDLSAMQGESVSGTVSMSSSSDPGTRPGAVPTIPSSGGGGSTTPSTDTVNSTEITRGLPQFVLTWTGEADIDLHVIDPTGNHVYWRNPAGHGEYLDSGVGYDPGGGPENIFYDPDTAPHGDYQVWVEYYPDDPKPDTGVGYRVRVRYSYDGSLQDWLSGTFTTRGEKSSTRTFTFP